jgi:hypothetical protein
MVQVQYLDSPLTTNGVSWKYSEHLKMVTEWDTVVLTLLM